MGLDPGLVDALLCEHRGSTLAEEPCYAWLAVHEPTAREASMALAPDGTSVFVAANAYDAAWRVNVTVLAYGAATGAARWSSAYAPPAGYSWVRDVVATPSAVLAAGGTRVPGSDARALAVALDPSTGAELWATLVPAPLGGSAAATAAAPSPDGSRLFLAGTSGPWEARQAFASGLDAATGAVAWARTLGLPGNWTTFTDVAAAPDGGAVYFTGGAAGPSNGDLFAVALDPASGATLWERTYDGAPGVTYYYDRAEGIAVSPDGATVVASGTSYGPATHFDYFTIAYDAATGETLWAAGSTGPGAFYDTVWDVAITPDGGRVLVTGGSIGDGWYDYATVAYGLDDGLPRWESRYRTPMAQNEATRIALSPDGTRAYVSGISYGPAFPLGTDADYATVGYDTATGLPTWAARYDNAFHGLDFGTDLAVGPTGRVFVTGHSWAQPTGYDLATVAYDP